MSGQQVPAFGMQALDAWGNPAGSTPDVKAEVLLKSRALQPAEALVTLPGSGFLLANAASSRFGGCQAASPCKVVCGWDAELRMLHSHSLVVSKQGEATTVPDISRRLKSCCYYRLEDMLVGCPCHMCRSCLSAVRTSRFELLQKPLPDPMS